MSSVNPVAKFTAGGGGGWLSTKKRGRDDQQIQRDSKRALEARKKKRPKKKPKKKHMDSDSDDDSSLNGFVVDDEEEISLEEESSDEEEVAVVRHASKRRGAVAAVAKRKLAISHGDEESLSEEEEDETRTSFFQKCKKRTSRSVPKPKPSNTVNLLNDSSSSSDDGFQEEKKDDDSSLSELEIVGNKANTSRFFSFQNNNKESSKNNYSRKKAAVCSNKKQSTVAAALKHDSDDDIKMQPARPCSLQHLPLQQDDDFLTDNEDEARAIELALQESLQKSKKPPAKRKRLKKKKKKKRTRVVVDISDDEEEEESVKEEEESMKEILLEESSQEEEVEDEYVDEEAREARSVLKAANTLSAKVLRTMTEWCRDQEGQVPQGMIVDGALAMSGFEQGPPQSSYISQDLMQRVVCPKVKLADYQLIGVNWLALLHGMTCNVEGGKQTNVNGVLADEMGLGKTVQTIAFLAWLKHCRRTEIVEVKSDDEEEQNGDGGYERPHIIIVPASVLTNWQREFEKFCPEMVVVKYHGSMAERQDIQEELRLSLPERRVRRQPLDVVLTTFSYFSSEKSDDRQFLRKFRFDYMVVDEAHCLKNPRGTRYRNLDKFVTSHRLLLTGTPVQNSPKELMSLLCFLMPLFSSPTKQEYEETTKDGGESMLQHFVALEGDSKTDADAFAYKKLKQLFAPFVLRRRKSDVLAQIIPPKRRKLEKVPFDEKTRMIYESILSAHVQRRKKIEAGAVSASAKQHIFTELRKAANHPLLLRTRHTSPEAIEHLSLHLFQMGYFGRDATCTVKHVEKELEQFSDFDIHNAALELIDESPCRIDVLSRYTLKEEDLFCSPKFVRLRTLLPELIAADHRILLFSQWTRCLDLVGCLMESLGLKFLRLDGQTAIGERQILIDKFNQDSSIPVFLLSTRAGGMGINLTAADVCILHDVDFNPFNDLQAEDRCHRLGQKKEVTVIKMVTEGTVDEDIYQMQQRKVQMNAAIMENGSSAKKERAKDEEEMCTIVDNAVSRFLLSPAPKDGTSDEILI